MRFEFRSGQPLKQHEFRRGGLQLHPKQLEELQIHNGKKKKMKLTDCPKPCGTVNSCRKIIEKRLVN